MQPKKMIKTNSKYSIVESQYSITNIKNNLKCSIQELRKGKKYVSCVGCDLIVLLISL